MLETYFSDLIDTQDPLVNYRKKAWDQFLSIGLPKRKDEAFQYLNQKLEFPSFAKRNSDAQEAADIVFVDGFYEASFSTFPSDTICLDLEKAIKTYGLFLQNRMNKIIDEETDCFACLNAAFLGKGAFLYIPPKCKAALHLKQIYTSSEMTSSRLQIFLGKDAELQLKQTSSGKSGFSNLLIDWALDSGARVQFIDESASDFQSMRASLKEKSSLKGVFLGRQLRNSIRIQLLEEKSSAEVYGLANLKEQEAHVHAKIEHIAANTHSRQHFKSVLQNSSRFSFEGKIYVAKDAHQTEAYQLNNNLILSDDSFAFAKPNLEIFCDDVKASHGSTTGQLNAEELFYLRSRGLDLNEAKARLINGFCQEIYDHAR